MTFEIDTQIFENMPAAWSWALGIATVVTLLAFVVFLPFAFDPAIQPKWWCIIPGAITVAGIIAAFYFGGLMSNETNSRYAGLYEELENKHGLTRIDLNESDKTFTAEDKDGRYVDCGMIPLDRTIFKVVCE